MTNPIYLKVKPDDTMWFFSGDVGDIADIVEDTNLWHKTYIEPHVPDCAPAINHTFKFKSVQNDHKSVLISGICNTGPIVIRGSLVRSLQALEARRDLITARERAGLVRTPTAQEVCQYITGVEFFNFRAGSVVAAAPAPPLTAMIAHFWETLDAEIKRSAPKTEIEYFLFREQGIAYIHFELGNDPLLVANYVQCVEQDEEGYKKWLKGETNPSIPRMAYEVDIDGNKTPTSLAAITLSVGTASGELSPDIWRDAILCPEGCSIFACNIDSGTLSGSNIALDDVMVKYYCRRADGTVCSPIGRESALTLAGQGCTCNQE